MCENAPDNGPKKGQNVDKMFTKVENCGKIVSRAILGCQGSPRRSRSAEKEPKVRFPHPLLEGFWATFSALFFFRASGTLKKGSGSAFKKIHLFLWISGSPRRTSGGFPSRRELNFHFCSWSQKGLQNASQNGAFWAPKSPLYSLWGTLWEKWVPKKVCQK